MAPICRSKKPASTRMASARFMTARNFRWRAGRPNRRPRSPAAMPMRTPPDRIAVGKSCLLKSRLLLQPAMQHFDIADVGAEHDVERVADQRHDADHAI